MNRSYNISVILKVATFITTCIANAIVKYECPTFVKWCKNGKVFKDEKYEKDCIDLMKRVAPLVDALANELHSCFGGMTPAELLEWIGCHTDDTIKHLDKYVCRKKIGIVATKTELQCMYDGVIAYLHRVEKVDSMVLPGNNPLDCVTWAITDMIIKGDPCIPKTTIKVIKNKPSQI